MIPRRPDMTPWLSFAYKLKKMFFTTPYFSPSLSTILATNQTPTCPGDVCVVVLIRFVPVLFLFFWSINVHRTPLETPVNFLYCFCHTRFHLGFSSKLRIWKVSSCKVEPRSGIIFGHNPTWHNTTTRRVSLVVTDPIFIKVQWETVWNDVRCRHPSMNMWSSVKSLCAVSFNFNVVLCPHRLDFSRMILL